ncbi:MAG: glycosyltransferase family 39 protein, partial [Candidatus Altiarchaeota archaeon]|nr:glycosyltransferase family 39 protein [Candidatus Altiarchaeota archaeon]
VASLAVRIFRLDEVPAGFYLDELFESYQAHSILETGRDLAGSFPFPLHLDLGNKFVVQPIYAYSTVISFYISGVSVFSARHVAAIYGMLTVFTTFLLARRMFNEKVGLLSAGLLAISPWHSFFSRVSFGFITLPFYFTLGVFLMYKGMEDDKKYLVYSAVPFGLTFYSYATSWLFTPMFLILALFIYRKKAAPLGESLLQAFVLFLVILAPFAYMFFSDYDYSVKRFEQSSIFNPSNRDINQIRIYFAKAGLPDAVSGNPVFLYTANFVKNYFSHVSPAFLFTEGGQNMRLSVMKFGELYLFQLPLIIAGLYVCIRRWEPSHKILVMWLLIFSIPADLTGNMNAYWTLPHPGRTINVVPVFEMLTALGLLYFISHKAFNGGIKAVILLLLAVLALFNVSSYFDYYFNEYPLQTVKPAYNESAFETNVGDVLSYVNGIKGGYDGIVLTGRCCRYPNYYISFFTDHNISMIHANPSGFNSYEIGNFAYYVDPKEYCYMNRNNSNTLYIIKENEIPEGQFSTLRLFKNPDGSTAFKVGLCKPSPEKPIYSWLVCGPFPNPLFVDKIIDYSDTTIDNGLDVDYINESSVSPSEGMACGVDKSWTRFDSGSEFIDMNLAISHDSELVVGYANAYIYSPAGKNVTLRYGSDDGVKIFLNNVLVHANHVHRPTIGVTDKVNLQLKPGWNSLLIKIESISGGWGLYANVRAEDDRTDELVLGTEPQQQ